MIDPESPSVPIWIVWSHMEWGVMLSGIALTHAAADRFRRYLMQEDAPRLLRVTIEPSYANHLYGGSMGRAAAQASWRRPREGD